MEVRMFHPYVSEQSIDLVSQVLRSRWIGQGPMCERFEREFADRFGYLDAVMVNSGTSAIHLALVMAGVGPGDEVITSALACTASNHAIKHCGALPVFADVQYNTGNIDPETIEPLITEKTKAILPIHWGGYPCNMYEIGKIATEHKLEIIQDAAHALGADYDGHPLDLFGSVCFSLQAIKTVTTVDGGMLVCGTPQRARTLRWFAIDRDNRKPTWDGYWEHDVIEVGYKYQPNDVLAAIGLGNLQDFDDLYEHRKAIFDYYRAELGSVRGVSLFHHYRDRGHGYWLFTMHVTEKQKFCEAMTSRGIEVSIVHRRNDIFSVFKAGKRMELPALDRLEKDYICLPLHNQLTDEQVQYVVSSIQKGW